jgi:hypothetical protein
MSVDDIWEIVSNTLTDLLRVYPKYRVHVVG